MDTLRHCRTCMSKKPVKNVTELKHKGSESTWSEILLFCLDIKVHNNNEESTKLCLKCFKKILGFYQFKLQAQKNDLEFYKIEADSKIKHEVFISDDVKDVDMYNEQTYFECFAGEVSVNGQKVKIEIEEENIDDCPSDNELLSVIKNIKYEYVSDGSQGETKENEPIKSRSHKKKVPIDKETTKPICEECGKSVRNLKDHMKLHRPPDSRQRVPCKLCEKTFSSYNARYKHVKHKHLGIKKICKICNKGVVNMRSHTLVVHQTSELQHECVPCGRRFLTQSALEAHATVHSSERPFACNQCDKRFRTKMLVATHIRQVHEKERSHLCQYCSKSFFKKNHLQIHLRSHTKEKPYECPECGKFFSSSTVLKNHRFLHDDSKVFPCSYCSMTFARPGYLRTHIATHLRIKKHPCKYCGVKFYRSDHRKRHEYTAHEKHMITTA